MQRSPASARQTPADVRSGAAERIIAFLRAKHPLKTAEHVSADTGLSPETVQTWIDRCSAPNIVGVILLVGAYGPECLAACMGERTPAWLTAAGQDAEIARLQAQREALDARLATLRNR